MILIGVREKYYCNIYLTKPVINEHESYYIFPICNIKIYHRYSFLSILKHTTVTISHEIFPSFLLMDDEIINCFVNIKNMPQSIICRKFNGKKLALSMIIFLV